MRSTVAGTAATRETTQTTIWTMAFAVTVLTWVVTFCAAFAARGGPISFAIAVSSIYAGGGLLASALYHAVSRQNNGIAIFIGAAFTAGAGSAKE